jgi:hypothetical protein
MCCILTGLPWKDFSLVTSSHEHSPYRPYRNYRLSDGRNLPWYLRLLRT